MIRITFASFDTHSENFLKAGHTSKFTLGQVQEATKDLDEYHKAKTYKEQKHLFLKTVTGLMTTYQAVLEIGPQVSANAGTFKKREI